MRRRCHLSLVILCVLLVYSIADAQSKSHSNGTAKTKAQIEADWLRQDVVRSLTDPQKAITTKEDALGACDGVKNGKWGFHTGNDKQPWWHVDLGGVRTLKRVLVFNRCDRGCAGRASRFLLLLSNDAKSWREVYRHNGTVFYGTPDKKPLSVPLNGAQARFVRIQLPAQGFLHLDEVEVYGADDPTKNLALNQPADQSSVSPWSTRKLRKLEQPYDVERVIERGRQLAADLSEVGVAVEKFERVIEEVAAEAKALSKKTPPETRRALYLRARRAVRKLALANPLLDFDKLLFVKRVPGSYSHMSDQYYGWWSRPGGGIYILEGFKRDAPRLRCLIDQMPEGSFLRPDLSYDGKKILFAYCKYYPHVAGVRNKVNKEKLPEDAFYHVFEMNVDGTGLRQLARGRYDDFDARYLPNGEIVFLSTRRGQFIQCGKTSAMETTKAALPDSYVRCGGGAYRPVAVYTLHVMDSNGGNIRAISPFENFEWTPSVSNDGRILYARWDYVDRWNMPFMSLWATNPDGTHPQSVYGNFTRSPYCTFEARSVPHSRKIIFTTSAHHSITGGSLALLDPGRGFDGADPLKRLTPEVCFPEIEGWPHTYYANPYPLSERYYLVAWSHLPLRREGGGNPVNGLGLYLYDAFGNLELIYRDPDISSMYPIPLRPRKKPPVLSSNVVWNGSQEGRVLVQNVYESLEGIERGTVKGLRIVGVPAKTQPTMNSPMLGVTRDDPGKYVLGTVPVEEDGSAYFRVPSGIAIFFQALDSDGFAIQTMRSLTYVQPNQTLSCVGCHEPRDTAPPNANLQALSHPPSKIRVGPEGSWPLRFDRLVQPVIDKHCVSCHRSDSADKAAAKFDLSPAKSYDSLISYGKPSLRDHVLKRYHQGKSVAGACAAKTSKLLALLRNGGGHYDVRLDADSLNRLATWMDTYGQKLGSFSTDQEERLRRLRTEVAGLLKQ